jgi:hypothetical protein
VQFATLLQVAGSFRHHFAGFSFVFLRLLAEELRLEGVLDIDVFFLELGATPTVINPYEQDDAFLIATLSSTVKTNPNPR